MKTILILGAGRSSSSLIRYLLDHASQDGYRVSVADLSVDLAKEKLQVILQRMQFNWILLMILPEVMQYRKRIW
jgi:hypothetical protein